MSTFLSVQFVPPSVAQSIGEPALVGEPVKVNDDPAPVTGGADGGALFDVPVQRIKRAEPIDTGDPVLGNPGPVEFGGPVDFGGGGGGGGNSFIGPPSISSDNRLKPGGEIPVAKAPGIAPLALGALTAFLILS